MPSGPDPISGGIFMRKRTTYTADVLFIGGGGMTAEKEPLPEEWLKDDPAVDRYDKKWFAWEQEVE